MWDEIVEKARGWAEQAVEQRRLALLDRQDAARSELLALLGKLADELEITHFEDSETPVDWVIFRLRPRYWRPDIHAGFFARRNAKGDWMLGLRPDLSRQFDVDLAGSIELGANDVTRFLGARQADYEAAVAKLAKELIGWFSEWAARSAVVAAHEGLCGLLPHETARWDELLAGWQARAAAEAEAWEQYRAALTAWLDEARRVAAHKEAAIVALRDTVNRPVSVRELEYALMARDDEGNPFVGTRIELVTADSSPERPTILRKGVGTVWAIAHPVRMSEQRTIWPKDDPWSDAFERIITERGIVSFPRLYRSLVEQALAELPDQPAEPSWEQIGGGRPWTEEVDAVRREVLFGNESE